MSSACRGHSTRFLFNSVGPVGPVGSPVAKPAEDFEKSLRGAIFPEDCQHFRHCQHRAQLVDHDSIRAAPEDRL